MAIDSPKSALLPPRNEENTSAVPVGLTLLTNAVKAPTGVRLEPWNGFTTGKSVELVDPVTYTLPVPSALIPTPTSSAPPPRHAEYTREDPVEFSLVTVASPLVAQVV